MSNIKGFCFGEVLWDNLPTGRKLGGAPLNVAYHLNKLGVRTDMLTRVGDDPAGRDLLEQCASLGVPMRFFQRDAEHATSAVEVRMDENRDVRYDIVFPVAWDYITFGEAETEAVRRADFFVFGSLSARNGESRQTLMALLDVARYKVLDLNLRAPHYSKERVFELMRQADLVKMNEEELAFVSEWLDIPEERTDRQKAEQIMDAFDVPEIIATYGASGSVYHSRTGKFSYHFPAVKVEVRDTIGSGDSFLAAFLSQRCRRDRAAGPEEIMEFAATLSAFVTLSSGACPGYDAQTINRFRWLHPVYPESPNPPKGETMSLSR